MFHVIKYLNHSEAYDSIKICSLCFFIYESVNTCEYVETSCLYTNLVFLQISKLQYGNSNSYFNLLLLLSGDTSSNSGPLYNDQLQRHGEWSVFNQRELHCIHINVNRLLPKIDKLRNITKLSNATVKGMVNQNWAIPFSHLKNTLMIMINFVVIGKQTREKSSLLHKE